MGHSSIQEPGRGSRASKGLGEGVVSQAGKEERSDRSGLTCPGEFIPTPCFRGRGPFQQEGLRETAEEGMGALALNHCCLLLEPPRRSEDPLAQAASQTEFLGVGARHLFLQKGLQWAGSVESRRVMEGRGVSESSRLVQAITSKSYPGANCLWSLPLSTRKDNRLELWSFKPAQDHCWPIYQMS